MSVRSTCKALVIDNDKILLNKCTDEHYGDYYSLPGGGQETDEFLEDAIIREVLEETGYTVVPEAFVGLGEEICMDQDMRDAYPSYIHKMYHIYKCHLDDVPKKAPTETDQWQVDCVWLPLDQAVTAPIKPDMVRDNLEEMLNVGHPIFLDSVRIQYHHG